MISVLSQKKVFICPLLHIEYWESTQTLSTWKREEIQNSRTWGAKFAWELASFSGLSDVLNITLHWCWEFSKILKTTTRKCLVFFIVTFSSLTLILRREALHCLVCRSGNVFSLPARRWQQSCRWQLLATCTERPPLSHWAPAEATAPEATNRIWAPPSMCPAALVGPNDTFILNCHPLSFVLFWLQCDRCEHIRLLSLRVREPDKYEICLGIWAALGRPWATDGQHISPRKWVKDETKDFACESITGKGAKKFGIF